MKRGTPRHPKVADFAQALGREHAAAIGYLELLWHFTADFAPQGDIGKYDDARIEAACYWRGTKGKLLDALTRTWWVDKHPSHRLVVHDWHDHADDAVRRKLQRAGLPFLSVRDKVTVHCPAPVTENSRLPEPSLALPVPNIPPLPPTGGEFGLAPPIPTNGHHRTKPASRKVEALTPEQQPWFEEFWLLYWRRDAKVAAEQSFGRQVKTITDFTEVKRGVRNQTPEMLTRELKHRPQASTWLNQRRWRDEFDGPPKIEEQQRHPDFLTTY